MRDKPQGPFTLDEAIRLALTDFYSLARVVGSEAAPKVLRDRLKKCGYVIVPMTPPTEKPVGEDRGDGTISYPGYGGAFD